MKKGFFGENPDTTGLPGDDGLPFLGHTISFYFDFYGFGSRMLAKHGEVYRSRAAMLNFVTVASPEAVDFVIRQNEPIFSCKEGWGPFYGRAFPNSLPVMDDDEHKHHRKILTSAFKKSYLVSYLELINSITSRSIADWQTDTRVEMFTLCKQLTLDVAAQAFLGIELDERAEFVGKTFLTLNKGIGALIPFEVPGLALWKSLRAQKVLLEFFRGLIAGKRGGEGNDVFSRLCNAKDEEGNSLTDRQILYHLLQFLAAAHDTSTTTLSVIFHHIMKHPEWQDAMVNEVDAIGTDKISFDDLEKMQKTDWVIREALRMFPAAPLMFRRAMADTSYKQYNFKAGNQVVIDIAAIHHSPKYWNNPESFDPARYSPERMEQKTHPYLWIPFGAGAHTCIGLHFTFIELKAILFHFFRQYRVESIGETDSFRILPITKPRKNLPLRIVRRH